MSRPYLLLRVRPPNSISGLRPAALAGVAGRDTWSTWFSMAKLKPSSDPSDLPVPVERVRAPLTERFTSGKSLERLASMLTSSRLSTEVVLTRS